MSSEIEDNSLHQEDSEDEFDWEEVQVPEHQASHLEITLQVNPKGKSKESKKRRGPNHSERLLRIDCHKIHTMALLANANIRNKWLNDPLLHARLLSLTPLHLQNAFAVIHPSRIHDQAQRGRMFERAIGALVDWWANTYFEVVPEGHVRSRTFDEIQQQLEIRGLHIKNEDDPDSVVDIETLEDILDDDAEVIKSEKSLMKHALMASGSRDTSAQLFTALCRSLGIPARLVVSVQSVPWKASVGKPKPNYQKKPKLKGKEYVAQEDEREGTPGSSKLDSMSEGGRRLDGAPIQMSENAKGKQKSKPQVKLRKTKTKGHVLGAGPSRLAPPDPLTTPPVYWTEVFSRPDTKWFPVDPIRAIVNKRRGFDPASLSHPPPAQPAIYLTIMGTGNGPAPRKMIPRTKVENRMLYVVAFEEDGYARDVTRRYAREYGAKVAKYQGGSSAPNMNGGGQGRRAWWESVMKTIERPYRLHRDDLEDQELNVVELTEGMPTTITGFKDHPLYVLERHLKQTDALHLGTVELGKFRGESVYPRSAVVSLKTAENWLRSTGRMIKEGEQPMKMVKIRAGTINKMRELEALKDELKVAGDHESNRQSSSASGTGGEIMQGLYAFSQTEPYVPEPVVNGKIPKNNFGNIDLYVPSMLPNGAAHIPYKGTAKIAKKLGFDYAEAVTGFEFKKRRAFPIVEGVVVASENEEAILEAYREAEEEAEQKARIKKEERVLKHWTKLIQGLRIRQRLQLKYGLKSDEKKGETKKDASKKVRGDHSQIGKKIGVEKEYGEGDLPRNVDGPDILDTGGGGFITEADKVVQVFHLPRNPHDVLPSTSHLPMSAFPSTTFSHQSPSTSHRGWMQVVQDGVDDDGEEEYKYEVGPNDFLTYDLDDMEINVDTNVKSAKDDDSDADMEEVSAAPASVSPSPGPATGTTIPVNVVPDEAPLTMQQLLEDAARQEKLAQEAGGEESIVEEIAMPGGTSTTRTPLSNNVTRNLRANQGGRASRSTSASIKDNVSASLNAASKGKGKDVSNGKRARPSTSKSTRKSKRKKTKGDEHTSDEAIEETEDEEQDEENFKDAEVEEVDDEYEQDDENYDNYTPKPSLSPRKRTRVGVSVARASASKDQARPNSKPKAGRRSTTKAKATAVTVPSPSTPASSSTRTLRPRRSKTAAQLAEEREQETAYRRAVRE